jgi:hypothetical protein
MKTNHQESKLKETNNNQNKKNQKFDLEERTLDFSKRIYWLSLLINNNPQFIDEINKLIIEAKEFIYIFTSIISKFIKNK